MELRKLSEDATTETIGWDPVAGATGYRFTTNGRSSHTFDPERDRVRILKGATVTVEALSVLDTGVWPVPPPPAGLPFPEAVLSNPIVVDNVPPTQTDLVLSQAGRDYLIDLKMEPRGALIITGSPRNVHIKDYHGRVTAPFSTGAFRRGGIALDVMANHVSITGYYFEGTPTSTDAFRYACAARTKITFQKFRIEAPHDSQEPSEHIDGFQSQGAVGAIEVGLGTMFVAGVRPPNHGGKGFQLDMINQSGQIAGPFPVTLNKVDFETCGTPSTGARSVIVIGKDDNNSIPISLTDVWGARGVANGPSFEAFLVNYPSALAKTITGTSPNRVMAFTNPAQGWSGTFRERAPGTHFVTREMLGI